MLMNFDQPHPREPKPSRRRPAVLPTIPTLSTSRRSPRRRALPRATVILGAVLSLAVAGCGNSPPARHATRSSIAAAITPTLPAAGGRSVATGALRATLNAENHTPKVNQPWPYALKVTNAIGQPLSGTVAIEFLLAGEIVARDKPPTHPITNGLWHSTLTFPDSAAGYPLTLRTIAHTSSGSLTLNWPITVQKSTLPSRPDQIPHAAVRVTNGSIRHARGLRRRLVGQHHAAGQRRLDQLFLVTVDCPGSTELRAGLVVCMTCVSGSPYLSEGRAAGAARRWVSSRAGRGAGGAAARRR